MAIKSYANKQAYDAAVKPTIESQVSLIETSREIIVDGVNVLTTEPVPGDAIFLDESNKVVFVKGGAWIQKAIIPTAWTWAGTVFWREGRKVSIVYKTGVDRKYADVLQYSISAISSTTPTINLRIQDTSKSGDAQYASNIAVTPTLTSTNIDATTAEEISAAVAAKATEMGDSAAWWAYLADANDNPVTENGTKIIIQCDTWKNWQQYNCGMTGGTIAFTTWGDMPASTVYFKRTAIGGVSTTGGGTMNMARRIAYINSSSNTSPAPSADVSLGAAMVRRVEFNESPYCQLLRDTYGTYEAYVEGDQMVMCPQKYGSFALPDGKTLSARYALLTAPTKSGGTKAKFTGMNYCAVVGFNADGLRLGDWFMPGVVEGTRLMLDDTLAVISPTITKMAGTAINNSTYRWFAQRYNANGARYIGGTGGSLNNYYVYNSYRCQAVTLLDI